MWLARTSSLTRAGFGCAAAVDRDAVRRMRVRRDIGAPEKKRQKAKRKSLKAKVIRYASPSAQHLLWRRRRLSNVREAPPNSFCLLPFSCLIKRKAFPPGDNGTREAVAQHVDARACHIEDGIDA